MTQDKEQKLEEMLDLMSDRESAYETACIDAAKAESEYRIRLAEEFLKASGAVEQRKMEAIKAVQHLLRERDRTEAIRDFTREKLRDVQQAVSARQTLVSADVRTNRAFA